MKIKKITYILTTTLIILGVLSSGAIAKGPFNGEDAKITNEKTLELETNFIWMNQSHFPGAHKSFGEEIRFDYGIRKNMDISLITSFVKASPYGQKNETGITDSRLIIKKNINSPSFIADENLAWYADVKLPTGDDKKSLLLGTGKTDYGLGLTYSVPDGNDLYRMSASYTLIGDPANIDYKNIFSYSFGLERPTDRNFKILFELSGSSRKHEIEETSTATLMLGAKKEINHKKSIYIGAGFGLTESAPDLNVKTGVNFRF